MIEFLNFVWMQIRNFIFSYFGIDLIIKATSVSPIDNLQLTQGILNCVCASLTTLFAILYAYRFIFTLIGFFHKKKTFPVANEKKRYCVIICARNEETVIKHPINSIKSQQYPQDLLDVIVVAHNCNDKTAEIAKEAGAIVYECIDPKKARKGYALEFIFDKLTKEGKLDYYAGFIVVDADCTISLDFVSKINDAFMTGKYDCIVSYPDTKNYNKNVITSAYGINYYRFTMSCHRPRVLLGVGTGGTGTGWLVSSKLLKETPFNCHTLSEDAEFVTRMTAKNYKIGFCEDAKTHIEHPTNFFVSCRQRIRCAKGSLVNFAKYFWGLLWSFFKKPTFTKYDQLCEIFPYSLIGFFLSIIYPLFSLIIFLITGSYYDWSSFATFVIGTIVGACIGSWFTAILVTIKEWKNINCSLGKAILYIIVFPWFDILAVPFSFLSLFTHVTWKRIPHNDTKDTETLDEEMRKLNKRK